MGKRTELEFLEIVLFKKIETMKIKFDFDPKKLEKIVLKKAKNIKFDLDCPKCKLYCWEYSLNELESLGQIYCNNCNTLINIVLSDK